MFETFRVLSAVLLGKIDGLKPRDERGSVTLEQAIVTGLLSILAVALLAAIGAAVIAAQARITA